MNMSKFLAVAVGFVALMFLAVQAIAFQGNDDLTIRVEPVEIDHEWRSELLEIARGRGVHNQIAEASRGRLRTWNNLNFRSMSEVRIAEALDRAKVLFVPNCRARLIISRPSRTPTRSKPRPGRPRGHELRAVRSLKYRAPNRRYIMSWRLNPARSLTAGRI